MQRIYVICFYDEEKRMLCVCAISANQLNSGHIGVEEGIRTPLIKWARLWRMNLGDMKQHKTSIAMGSQRAHYTVIATAGQIGNFDHGQYAINRERRN